MKRGPVQSACIGRPELAPLLWSAVTARSVQTPDLEGGRWLVTKDLVVDRHAGEAPLASGRIRRSSRETWNSGKISLRGDTSLAMQLAMAFAVKGDDRARKHIDELRDLAVRSHSAIFHLHADLAEACHAAVQDRTAAFVAGFARLGPGTWSSGRSARTRSSSS